VILSLPREQRTKPVAVLCTDTRVEIPAIVEMVETTLARMQRCATANDLNIEVQLLRPPPEQSFWVNIIGRGYPPPNRTFRWCTQRMKIDPMTRFVESRVGHWGEAIFILGARRAESSTRAQAMAGREMRNGLRRHDDLPRVWIANPIEHLSTEEVWAYLLQKAPPWGGSNRALYRLYADAAGGECPIQIDKSTPSCGNSRFGCWTCTVVDKDKASEGLLSAGDERMEQLIHFRDILIHFRDPANGKRDTRRMNGDDGHGPLLIESRRELLKRLLKLQEETGLTLINEEELLLIQRHWNAARNPDDGNGVARIVHQQKGIMTTDLKETSKLRALEEQICHEKKLSHDTLRRLLAKVEEYSESHRAQGLPDDLYRILNDELNEKENQGKELASAEE
ncbi:MAG: DNA phosphorothioation system sulfurtransferase DndC, partial [Armatimonadota bacterium]|nr:DNA phosphorothioation system sulfurtransferase DndC [Armatimonadota bacterium]